MSNGKPTGPLGIISLIAGIVSVMFALMGCLSPCMFMPISMLCGGAGAACGYMETQAINRGESSEAGRSMALIGMVLGGGALLWDLVWLLLFAAFVVLYFVFVIVVVALGG